MNEKINHRAEGTLDPREIVSIVWARKWLIIIPVILATLCAFGISFLMAPIYESSNIVQVDASIEILPELGRIVGSQQNNRRQTGATLRDKLKGIYNQITSSYYAQLLSERLSLGSQPAIQEEARAILALREGLTMEQSIVYVMQSNLKKNVSVRWAAGDQIEITVKSTNPLQAKKLADNIADIFIGEKLKEELARIRTPGSFTDNELERKEIQLAERIAEKTKLERELIEIQLDENISSESNRSEITSEIDRTQEDINELRNRERLVLGRLSSFEDLNSVRPTLKSSRERETLTNKIKEELGSVGALLIRYTWSDPQILQFKLRLNNILSEIEREHERLILEQFPSANAAERRDLAEFFNIQVNLNYHYAKKPYLEDARHELRIKASLIPEYNAKIAEITQQITAISDLRARLQKQQESEIMKQTFAHEMSSSKYRVVEPAKQALIPISPNRNKITIMGLVFGFVIGGAALLLVELFDGSFRRVEDVEEWLGLPVLAIIPKIDVLKKM